MATATKPAHMPNMELHMYKAGQKWQLGVPGWLPSHLDEVVWLLPSVDQTRVKKTGPKRAVDAVLPAGHCGLTLLI